MALYRQGIKDKSELLKSDEVTLAVMPGIGKESLKQIKSALKDIGYTLPYRHRRINGR